MIHASRNAFAPMRAFRLRVRQLVQLNYGDWRGAMWLALAQFEWLLGRLDQWTKHHPQRVRRLVFVCRGNINRSAFAAEVARTLGAHVASFGLAATPDTLACGPALTQARRQGYDLSLHQATHFSNYAYAEGDLVLVMEVRHAHQLVALGVPTHAIALLGYWAAPRRIHLHDPQQLSLEYFATCFTVIESAVRRLVAQCVIEHPT
jgi:low molecular weight protein-tyrosine phosphatase